MDITSVLNTALGGGVFGLLGNAATKVIGIFEAREAFAQKKEEWSHDERMLDMQMKAKAAENAEALAAAAAAGSWSAGAERWSPPTPTRARSSSSSPMYSQNFATRCA